MFYTDRMNRDDSPETNNRNSGSSQESYSSAVGDADPVWAETGVIGHGGFGKVTLWKNTMNGASLVIKEFQAPSMHSFSTDEQRFMDEARMVMKLNHRNIVRAIDLPEQTFSRQIENLHLCMEYCEGGDLRNVLLRPENFCGMQESQFRTMCADIADGIKFLHMKEITHRDLKPENILLKNEHGKTVYKLSDFGYAKEAESNRLQSMVGTLQYAAPEVLRVSHRPYRRSVDCWSFGIVVFECACGRRPFLHDDVWIETLSLVEKKRDTDIYIYKTANGSVEYSEHIPKPNQLSNILVAELEGWFLRVLEANPDKRDGKESLDVLKDIVNTNFLNVVNMSTGNSSGYDVRDGGPLKKLEHHIGATMLGGSSSSSGMFLLLENGQQLTRDFPLLKVCEVTSSGTVFVFSEQQMRIKHSSSNEQAMRRIVSGEAGPLEPHGQQKRAARGQALCSIIKLLNQFNSLVQGLNAASQFADKMQENKNHLSNIEEICVEIKARCSMLQSSWDTDSRELSSLQRDQGVGYEDLKHQWLQQQHTLDTIFRDLSSDISRARMLSENFEVQYSETKEQLHSTVQEVVRITSAWTEDNGLLSRGKELFKSLRSRSTCDESKDADFQSTLVTMYSQCGDVMKILSRRNFYSDLLEMLTLVIEMEKINRTVKSNGKRVLEMQEKRQIDMWTLIKGRGRNSELDGSIHSDMSLSPETPRPGNFSSRISSLHHSHSEPQPPHRSSPRFNVLPRQTRSTDVASMNEFHSMVEHSMSKFDRTVSVRSPVGAEEISHRFQHLLSTITMESNETT